VIGAPPSSNGTSKATVMLFGSYFTLAFVGYGGDFTWLVVKRAFEVGPSVSSSNA